MALAGFICVAVATVIFSALSVVAKYTTSIFDFVFKLLGVTSCLVLALVSANLSSSFGGYTIFIALGLALTIALSAFKCVKGANTDKISIIFMGVTNALSYACFAIAGLLIISLNIWGLLAGLFLGLAISFFIMIFRKLKLTARITTSANIALCGMFFGQAITLLVTNAPLVTSILYFLSSFIALFQIIFGVFVKNRRALEIVSSVSYILSLILIAGSIYFLN